MQNKTEYWLRGAVPDVPEWLQPVAHALLQAEDEIYDAMHNFPGDQLWQTPAGVASPAFHLQHIVGVLNRLFTYANGSELSEEQLSYLKKEGKRDETITVHSLLQNLQQQINFSVEFLKKVQKQKLTEVRYVGRKKIPSSQLGLLFHAAEHTMRHTGQLLVTVKIILNEMKEPQRLKVMK
ncbi:MAG: DinB family protein [Bacteroidota bacterium]|nr:DinB family protein [Bacteroidota bacterium]